MIREDYHNKDKTLNIIFLLTILIYLVALFIPILRNDDSLLYANISKNMILSKSWFLLYQPLGIDWLDKPHFPFWLISLFFSLFGISSLNYVLVGMLFNFIGVFYTYKLAKVIYANDYIAKLSALILLTSFHIFFSATIDIRAEVYLIASIVPSYYYLYKLIYLAKFNFKNLLLTSMFAAFAVMTKGIFTLITIYSIILPLLFLNKATKKIFGVFLLQLILTIIFLSPELLALYLQFQHKLNGIKWFLWDSQFGRFFNNGSITRNNVGFSHYFFYIHTYFWSILPWSMIFLMYLKYVIKNFGKIFIEDKVLLSSFLVTFVLFSVSKFQLDYYINIIIPFSSILVAKYIYDNKFSQILHNIVTFLLLLLTIILSLLILYITIINNFLIIMMLIIIVDFFAFLTLFLFRNVINKIILVYPIIIINWILILIFIFYGLIYKKYEAGYNIAKDINKNSTINLVIDYNVQNLALEFYVNKNYKNIREFSQLLTEKSPYFLVTDTNNLDFYINKGYKFIAYDNITMDKILPYLLKINNSRDINKKLFVIKVEK